MRLNLNLDLHPVQRQLANLHTRPDRPVGHALLELLRDQVEGMVDVDVVAAHRVDVIPGEPLVDVLERLLDVVEGLGYLLREVAGDVAVLVPSALSAGLDCVADFDCLAVVEALWV